MNKKIVTCYSPFKVNNQYADNTKRLIRDAGYEVVSIKKCFSNIGVFTKCKIFNFNWFEKIDTGSVIKNKIMFTVKKSLIYFLKLTNKRIIYTLHNKQPHDSPNVIYSKKLMRYLVKKSDIIISLCPDTNDIVRLIDNGAEEKIRFAPHAMYHFADEYCKRDFRKDYGFDDDDLIFLFMGFVSPYKNVESIIKIIKQMDNPKIKLLIVGKACNEEYEHGLVKLIDNNKNIITHFGYVNDNEIPTFYNTANIVVLPYHKDSSLNSGAVYLSFSLKKTVVCPNIGTINGMQKKDFIYDYSYKNNIDHVYALKKTIMRVCNDYERDKSIIENKGKQAYDYMLQWHNDDIVRDCYKRIYDEIIG